MKKKKVLFICTANSCRSQMAEALVNHYLSDDWVAYSAGTEPADQVHIYAVFVMNELGIDITGKLPKSVTEFREINPDLVITLCDDAADNCPLWLGQGKVVHIGFPDPAKKKGSTIEQIDNFRSVRDEIHLVIFKYLEAIKPELEFLSPLEFIHNPF